MNSAARIAILTPSEALASGDRDGRWAYLGKDVKLRRAVESVRSEARLPLGRGLQNIADDLRRPFLDFVAEVGQSETDAVAWWSTTFSWRVWGASDLFLFVCYLQAAQELIDAARSESVGLTLVVEDDWLATQIAANNPPDIQCSPRALPRAKLKAVALGVARRVAWLGQTLGAYWRQRRLGGLAVTAAAQPTAAIYSYPMERCLRAGGAYADALLPGMDNVLRESGHRVVFISPPERSGFEMALAERRDFFRPMILFGTVRAVTRALFARWRPRRRTWPSVGRLRIDYLALREFWCDASRAQWCRFRFFFECARRMLQASALEWVVFPFENQPWEKLLVLAAREAGAKTAGVQHSTIGRNYLSYFLGRGEAGRMPLPDAVLTAGTYAASAMIELGFPPERVLVAGSMRYPHLAAELPASRRLEPASPSTVLVGLPIDRPMAEHLLAALAAAFPGGGKNDGITFLVKSHPMTPVDPVECGLAAESHDGSVEDALVRCGTVVYVGSTIGPEAAAYGRAVLRYASDLLLDVDVSEGLRPRIPVAGDRDLRRSLLHVIGNPPAPAAAMTPLFSPVNWDGVNRLFLRTSRPIMSLPDCESREIS